MKQLKLIDLLSPFGKSQWSSCKRFINARYRSGTIERRLFDQIYKHKYHLGHKSLSTDALYEKFSPNGSKSDFYNMVSRLGKTVEDFIIQEELSRSENLWERKMLLAKYYKRSGSNKRFKKEATSLLAALEGTSDYDHIKRLKLFSTRFELSYSELSVPDRIDHLEPALEDLTAYAANMSLLLGIEIKNNRLSDERVTSQTKSSNCELYTYLTRLRKLVNEKDDACFDMLLNQYTTQSALMSNVIGELSLLYLINHCYIRMKKGDKEARNKLLELYLGGLNSGILLSNGLLSERRLLNIVEAMSNLDSDADHTPFIEYWVKRTETNDIESLKNLALAFVCFGKEEYEDALSLLLIVKTHPKNINITSRTHWLTICCKFGLYPNYGHKAEALNAERKFLQRSKKKIGPNNYKGGINLMKILEMLWGNTKLEKIRSGVERYDNLLFRHWIEKELEKDRTQRVRSH